jgi:uncharacterized membrane protein
MLNEATWVIGYLSYIIEYNFNLVHIFVWIIYAWYIFRYPGLRIIPFALLDNTKQNADVFIMNSFVI